MKTAVKTTKRTALSKVDFSIDEKIWRKISKDVKKVRAQVFRRRYGRG